MKLLMEIIKQLEIASFVEDLIVLLVVVLIVVLLLRLSIDLGPDISDFLREWRWGWKMSAFGLETVLISCVVDCDWCTVWSSVAVISLSSLDFSILNSSVFHESMFLGADAVSSFISVLIWTVMVLLRVKLDDWDGGGWVVVVISNWAGTSSSEKNWQCNELK